MPCPPVPVHAHLTQLRKSPQIQLSRTIRLFALINVIRAGEGGLQVGEVLHVEVVVLVGVQEPTGQRLRLEKVEDRLRHTVVFPDIPRQAGEQVGYPRSDRLTMRRGLRPARRGCSLAPRLPNYPSRARKEAVPRDVTMPP